ncbi:hypothetical protein RB595_007300 [Gaeumannomyces hyphopodioides]
MPLLSRQGVHPLLGMVGGRSRRSAARASLREESSSPTTGPLKDKPSAPIRAFSKGEPSSPAVQPVEDDAFIHAPPESSSDEDSDGASRSASTRGAITSSLFGPPKPKPRKEQQASGTVSAETTTSGKAQGGQRSRKAPERASRSLSEITKDRKLRVEGTSDDDIDAVDEPIKRPGKSGAKPGFGSHLETQVFLRSSQKYTATRTKQFQTNKRKGGDEEPPRKTKVRVPKRPNGSGVDSDASSASKRPRFIMPVDSQVPDTPTGTRFKAFDSVISPPSGDSKKPSFKGNLMTDSPLRGATRFKMLDLDTGDDKSPTSRQEEPLARTRGRALSVSSSSSSLTELESVQSDGPDLCPMCDAPIDADLLDGLTAITMSIAKQQKICQLHKRREANAQWKEKGYPTIDWDSLESRFERQHDHLDKVLRAEADSHYRDVYSRKVESGKGRTLLTSEKEAGGSLTPGYYGYRGARLMSEWLIRRFSAPLRRRAVKDRLVAARGHTTYVQSVLVPELAARLVAEDLEIKPEAARDVLRESARLGELVHEEVRDVVRREPSDDEDDF